MTAKRDAKAKKITKECVDAMQAGLKPVFLWDSEVKGFGVKLTPTGTRTYIYQYRLGGRAGRTQRVRIGQHGSITPDQARAKAKLLAAEIVQGSDPAKAKREKAAKQLSDAELAFDAYCQRYLDARIKPEKPRSYANVEMIFRLHAVPRLKTKALPDITKRDVVRVIEGIPATSLALRRSTHAILRKMFAWAVARDDIAASPMTGMDAPEGAADRDRVLSDTELVLVWQAASALGYPFGTLFRLLASTGQRREEVAALDWCELDRESQTWTLPASRSKNGVEHIIPLNALAAAELDSIAALNRYNNWPSNGPVLTTNGKVSISGYSKAKRRLDAEMQALAGGEIKPWRTHDLRRTVATGLQKLGVRFEVTEAVLNHTSGSRSGVAGVYQRHDWKEEKRAALDAWARHVAQMLTPADTGNVVAFAATKQSA